MPAVVNIVTKPTLADHETRIKGLECDISKHESFISGNGNNVGAKTQMALLEKSVSDIKDSMKNVTRAVWGLALSIIGSVIIWFITVYLPNHI